MQTVNTETIQIMNIGNIEASFTQSGVSLFLFNKDTGEGMCFPVEEVSVLLEKLITDNF